MDLQIDIVYLVPLALVIILITSAIRTSHSKLPPGPWRLPLIGNLHQIGANPHHSLAKLAQTHGPVMSLKLGQVTAIFISSASAAKQVMQKQDNVFANRHVPDATNACNHGKLSVIWVSLSPLWRESRKVMNTLIFNSQKIEASASMRQQKVKELLDDVRTICTLGEGVLIGEVAFKTTLNVISPALFSMNIDSVKAKDFKEGFQKVMVLGGTPNIVDYFPWLTRFDPQSFRAKMDIQFSKMLAFLDSVIDERLTLKAEHSSSYEKRDVLDGLPDISETNEEINGKVIRQLLVSLIIAGTDTTSVSTEWAMSEMLKNKDIMSKAKAELEQTLGRGTPVKEDDIERLPYLKAIIKETFRVHPPAPFLLPRKTLKEVELWDYRIPKGSQVVINSWAISRDPSTWDDPTCFKPERFLKTDVDYRGADFELTPFGAGWRICPGLPLAHKMVHTMSGSLVNCFDWELEGGANSKDINLDETFGITLQKTMPLCICSFTHLIILMLPGAFDVLLAALKFS